MKYLRRIFAIAMIVMGVMVPMKVASSQGLPPGQLPTLTGEWWQWAMSIPTSVNPLLDTTGERCMIGQRGSIWFLTGVNGGGSATLLCSVPEDAALFFPVINSFFVNTPNCGQGPENLTVKSMRTLVKPFIDAAQNLSVTVGGNDVKKTLLRRVQSEPFAVAFPEDNIFGPDACAVGMPLAAGIYSPAVDDGYYVALPPLKPGSHTLHFHADSGTFTEDVTYNLTVEQVLLQ